MPDSIQFTQISEARIAWEVEGEGPIAVFVHGFGSNRNTWKPLLPLLTDGSRKFFRYDLRGFGESSAPLEASFNHSDDLHQILDEMVLHPCDLIGVSMGGSIAINAALNNPHMVRSLILISPDIVGWEWSEPWKAYKSEVECAARRDDIGAAKRLWWLHPMFSTTRSGSNSQLLREEIQHYSGNHWIHSNPDLVEPDIERLHTLNIPTLLLTGGKDFEDLKVIASLIEASSPLVERQHNEACGHLLHFDNPAWCATHIRNFLKKHSPA